MNEETRRQNTILAEVGASADHRLWRNFAGAPWVGRYVGTTTEGHVLLADARKISTGLVTGASDLVGIGPGGRFMGLEVKVPGERPKPHQRGWLELIQGLGGVGAVVNSPEHARTILDLMREGKV